MKNDLISLIVPVFNVEKYLERCLHSLLNQTYKNIEIIIVDDGSTDHSYEIYQKFVAEYNIIKIINKKNAGLGLARNTGIEIAEGKYCVFIDSDDYIDETMVEDLHTEILKYSADVCYSGFIIEHGNGHTTYGIPPKKLIYKGDEIQNLFLPIVLGRLDENQQSTFAGTSVCTAMYDLNRIKNLMLNFKSERDILCEDCIFNFEYCKNASSIAIIPASYYHYCENPASLTRKVDHSRFYRVFNFYRYLSRDPLIEASDVLREELKVLFIKNIQNAMKRLIVSDLSFINKLDMLKYYLEDKNIMETINENEYRNLSIHHRILIWLILHKHVLLIYLYATFNVKLRRLT